MTLHQTNSCASCSIYLHVILFLFIILLCLQLTTTAPAPTNETDRLALLKFKESVPHDPYKILSSWNDSTNFCNWLGITCDGRHQRVTALDLQGYNLRGPLSSYIGNLSFLRSIKLQNNSFYGEIPWEVGNLFQLQELRLNNNTLEGQIPPNLSKCSNLRFIHLHVNNFTGKIPMELGSLMKLEELQLLKNNLAGGIPPSLGNLSSLKSFAAEYNNLVGNIPDTIGRLKGLVVFSILMNNLSEYAWGCETSTKGDVYSYGIIILEMFLGKRPTDEMFKDDLNLHNYVKMAVAQPKRLVQIVDPILRREVEERPVQMDAIVHKCLFPILQLGLACSVPSPEERMNMEEVTKKLHLIKIAYLSSRIWRGGRLSSGIQVEGKSNEIMLQPFFEENSIRAIKQIPIPRGATPDKLVWLGETSGNFSLKSSYLTEHGDRFDQKYNQDWKKLWESKLHERLKMFLWRLAKGELPLKTRLANSIGCEDLSCVLCGEAEETELHVFHDCIVIRMLWFASEIGLRWDHFEANSAEELVQMILNPPEELITEGLNQNKFTLMAAVICYETWRMRQLMLSKNVKFDPVEFPWRIKSAMESFSPRKENDRQCKEREKEEGWCPPPRGWIKIKVDASWSEGKATVAGLARNCRGEFLKAWAERVDAESVAIAECLAIGLAIQAAIEEGYEQVKIEGDAKIVFDTICNTGQSECWELHQYVEMIRSVVKESETPKFRFNWVLTGFLGF